MSFTVRFLAQIVSAGFLGFAPAAMANAAEEASASNLEKLFQGAPKYKDTKGNWLKLRGRLYWDFASLAETPTGGVETSINDNKFRAARMGVQGEYGKFTYVGELDFAAGKTTFKDVNIAWKGPVTIKAGQMKTTNSMEETSSSRHISFLERGMITDAVGLDRRVGISIARSGKNFGLAAGVYSGSINASQDGKPGTRVISTRGTFAPINDKGRVVHLGISARHTADAIGAPNHSARWGAHLAREIIQPVIGGDALLIGLEAATVMGSFHAHAEYMQEKGDMGETAGGFVQAGYFLTGENRNYKAGSGKFDRTKPGKPLSAGGVGGWEIAARYDTLDASNAGDEKADAWTAGLTWYPQSHLRVKLNYTDASGDRFMADGVQLRIQVDW